MEKETLPQGGDSYGGEVQGVFFIALVWVLQRNGTNRR